MPATKAKVYKSVWDALTDSPEESANMQIKSDLMRKLEKIIKEKDWTQAEAAAHCRLTQPRVNDLLRGRISRFSLDALVNIAVALGLRVRIELKAA